MSNQLGKELFEELEKMKMFDYGKHIPVATVRKILQLDFPETAPKKVYDQLMLVELGATDYVRNILLGRGMYLKGDSSGYRILHASENLKQVEAYMTSADKKLARSLKLLRSTPRERQEYPSQTEARAEMKRNSIQQHREHL